MLGSRQLLDNIDTLLLTMHKYNLDLNLKDLNNAAHDIRGRLLVQHLNLPKENIKEPIEETIYSDYSDDESSIDIIINNENYSPPINYIIAPASPITITSPSIPISCSSPISPVVFSPTSPPFIPVNYYSDYESYNIGPCIMHNGINAADISITDIEPDNISKKIIEIELYLNYGDLTDIEKNDKSLSLIQNKKEYKNKFLYFRDKIYNKLYTYVYCENGLVYEVFHEKLLLSKIDDKFTKWQCIKTHKINISSKFLEFLPATKINNIDNIDEFKEIKFLQNTATDSPYIFLKNYLVADNYYLYDIQDNKIVKAIYRDICQKWNHK
jgi:hypothetical protein